VLSYPFYSGSITLVASVVFLYGFLMNFIAFLIKTPNSGPNIEQHIRLAKAILISGQSANQWTTMTGQLFVIRLVLKNVLSILEPNCPADYVTAMLTDAQAILSFVFQAMTDLYEDGYNLTAVEQKKQIKFVNDEN
jgi:hypothetical protein